MDVVVESCRVVQSFNNYINILLRPVYANNVKFCITMLNWKTNNLSISAPLAWKRLGRQAQLNDNIDLWSIVMIEYSQTSAVSHQKVKMYYIVSLFSVVLGKYHFN